MPPQHFSPTGAVEMPTDPGPGFDTPLGRMVFVVSEFGEPVDVTAAWRTGPYTVWQWTNGVELMLNPRLAVTLPPGLALSGAAAALVRALLRADSFTQVACLWSPRRRAWDHVLEPGDNVTAATWSNGTTLVTIGLPDLGDQTETRDDGFVVDVVPEVGRFQTHFVCASAPTRTPAPDSAGWFTVGLPPEDLLAVAD